MPKHACTGRLVIVALSAQPPGVNELCVCVYQHSNPHGQLSKTKSELLPYIIVAGLIVLTLRLTAFTSESTAFLVVWQVPAAVPSWSRSLLSK
jgi:hypothetical protein